MDNLTKLRYWTFKILPLVYDDSLSYYEVLTKVTAKVNELIDSNNSMPQAITNEITKQLDESYATDINNKINSAVNTVTENANNQINKLANEVYAKLITAIATDEGTNTFTKDAKSGGELIFLNNTLYKVTAVMQAGTNYIVGTNIAPINISEELKTIKETYISSNNEYWNERSTNNYNAGIYLFWKDILYITTKDVHTNDILYADSDNQNLKQVTLASEITDIQKQIYKNDNDIDNLQKNLAQEATARQSANNTLQGNINSEAATRASADSNLQSQINQLVAPSGEAPSAAEVQNARIGADNVTYPTLGDAIRTQIKNINAGLVKDEESVLFNLLKIKLATTSSNGVTYTNNGDGTITLTGTATAETTFILTKDYLTPRSGIYTLCGVPNNASGWYVQCDGLGRDNGGGATGVVNGPNGWFGNIYIRIASGTSFGTSGVTFRPIITTLGSISNNLPTEDINVIIYNLMQRTNVIVKEVNSNNYATVLPDANNASANSIYNFVFGSSDGNIPSHLPVKHIQGTNAMLVTYNDSSDLYAIQLFITNSAIFRRIRTNTSDIYTQWKILSGTFYEYVGTSGRFFTTLKSALEAVSGLGTKENHVVVYVDSGTYDLLSESGGDAFLASITPESGNRNGLLIPKYVDVIGLGNVYLKMNIPDAKSNNYTVEKISALEVMYECTLKNLIITAKNCRYCIHDETGGNSNYGLSDHKYENIYAIHLANTAGSWTSQDAFGCGISRRNNYEFKNCSFKSDSFLAFGLHNNENASECNIVFDGVTFDGSHTFGGYANPVCASISYYKTNALSSRVVFKNINADKPFIIKPETSQVPSNDIYEIYNYSDLEVVRI